jgi:hypothetical protein
MPPTPPAPTQNDVINAKTVYDTLSASADLLDTIYAKYGKAANLIIGLEGIAAARNTDLFKALYDQMERASQVPRQLAAEITNSSVLASDGMSAVSKNFTDSLYKDQQRLADESITIFKRVNTATGQVIESSSPKLAAFFKDAKELNQAFFDSAVAETRLYMAAMRDGFTDETFKYREIAALANKGLGVDATTLRALYQEEFSKTGKITGEFVEKYAATIMAASAATGLSTKQIAGDLAAAKADIEKFGNSSEAQIAALSVPIRKLGLDMKDVGDVIGKFMRFEDATQAVSNFAAVTGASLDTMDLFYKANSGDKLDFFKSLKQQLTDQGVAIENLTHQEQVYLAKGLGLNLRQFQSFMREDADITEDMIDEMIEENAKKTEYTGKDLADKLAQTGGLAAQTLEAMKPENIKQIAEVVRALAGGTGEFADAYNKFGTTLLGMTEQAMPQFSEAGKEMSKSFVTGVGEMQGAWTKLDGYLTKNLEDGAFKQLVEYIKQLFTPRSVPPAFKPIEDGLIVTNDAVLTLTSKMTTGVEGNLQDAQKRIAAGAAKAANEAGESFQSLLEKNKADQEKINSAIVKAADDQKRLQADLVSIGKFTEDRKLAKYDDKQIEGLLQGAFKDKQFGSISEQEFKSIMAAKAGPEIEALLPKLIKDRADKALAELQGGAKPESPTAPAVPGAAPAAPGSPAAPAAGTTPRGAPAGATGPIPEMVVKLALEFVGQELKDLIDARIILGASEGVMIPTPTPGISGTGQMKIRLEAEERK